MNRAEKVFLYWFTGLSGAGKTTIGKEFYSKLLKSCPNSVFLDGDELRKIFDAEHCHTIAERKHLAMCYARLGALLAKQGFNVVCCTISMFQSVRKWNRENIPGYREIYIRVSMEELMRRDQKGIYSGHLSGKHKNIMGLDLDFEEPSSPDLIIDNDGTKSLSELQKILQDRFL